MLNVRDFGAVGDGATDDAPAIQAAISYALANSGGQVMFPKANYQLATGLVLEINGDGGPGIDLMAEAPGTFLRTVLPIDMLTMRSNGPAGNLRRVNLHQIGFNANNPGATALKTENVSYCHFVGMEFLGHGKSLVIGGGPRSMGNQLWGLRFVHVGEGPSIDGAQVNVTNLQINEGIQGGRFALKLAAAYSTVNGFAVRGSGGSGGNAAIEIAGSAAQSSLMNGVVFDSYAAGIIVGGARGVTVSGVAISNSQREALRLSGPQDGAFDVFVGMASEAGDGAHDSIYANNGARNNLIRARFSGTKPRFDYCEAENNAWANRVQVGNCPNGWQLSSTGGSAVAA